MPSLHSKHDGNYKKYIPGAYDAGLRSINSKERLTFTGVPRIGTVDAIIKNTPANKQAILAFRDEAFKKWKGGNAREGITVQTDRGEVQFSRIDVKHTKDSIAKFNKGNVVEGLLAAAIAARMINKTKNITEADVVKVLKGIKRTGKQLAVQSYKSPNENPKIIDKVNLEIGLAEQELDALFNPKIIKDFFGDLMKSSVYYSNQFSVKSWADLLYRNNRVDTIKIDAAGLEGQKDTKVDLYIYINGEKVDLNISLKADSVKQFGQISGARWDVMTQLFTPLGVKFTNADEAKFNAFLASNKLKMHSKTVAAVSYAYQVAAKQLTNNLKYKQEETVEKISKFIQYHMTLNEPGVSLVQLDKREAKIYEFDKLLPALRQDNKELTVTVIDQDIKSPAKDYIESGMKLPRIVIHPTDFAPDMGLLEIRSKIDAKGATNPFYHRNYLNKSKYLTKLIAY